MFLLELIPTPTLGGAGKMGYSYLSLMVDLNLPFSILLDLDFHTFVRAQQLLFIIPLFAKQSEV